MYNLFVRSLRDKDLKDGIFFGILLLLSVFQGNLIVILILYVLLTNKLSILKIDFGIFLLLILKITWIMYLALFMKGYPLSILVNQLFVDIILVLMLFIKKDITFFYGLSLPIFMLFYVDFIFNLSTLITGADLLGRVAGVRPDDIIARLGGVMFHPFYSINISFIAFAFSILLKNRIVLILAFINIISNGSMRGALILFIFLILFYLIYRKKSRILLISTMLISIIFVFSITVFSVAYLGDNSGNYFRVIAWISDLEQLYNNPLFGGGPFLYSNYPGNSIQAIQEFGIAESPLLDIGIRYGIFPMFIYLYVIYKIFNKFYFMNKVQHSLENTVFTTIASVVLVDIFYGTFLGSTFTTAIFGLMAFSYQNKRFFVNKADSTHKCTTPN